MIYNDLCLASTSIYSIMNGNGVNLFNITFRILLISLPGGYIVVLNSFISMF